MSIKVGTQDVTIACDKLYIGNELVYEGKPALNKRQILEALVTKALTENPNNVCYQCMSQLINSTYWTNNIGNIPLENYDNINFTCAFVSNETLPVGRIWIYMQNGNITYNCASSNKVNFSPSYATSNGLKKYSWLYNQRSITTYYGESTDASTSNSNALDRAVFYTTGTITNPNNYPLYNQDVL